MDKIKKHKRFIKYIGISTFTTIINILSYMTFIYFFSDKYILSNIFAWIISVFISFILSKKVVFNQKSENKKKVLKELVFFYVLRLTSLLIDTIILYICIEKLKIDDIWGKIISNIGTTFNNYFVSKYLIFKTKSNFINDCDIKEI